LWRGPPALLLRSAAQNQRKHQGKPLKTPDIGHFAPGGLILSTRAVERLGETFKRFGELREIQVEDETWFNYDVTHFLGGLLDLPECKRSRSGTIKRPAFLPERLPTEPSLFKLPDMQGVDTFFNEVDSHSIGERIRAEALKAGEMPLVWPT
jgi:hypothetical protein